MKKLTISSEEIKADLDLKSPNFPKYTSFLINQASRTAQATRPKIVGQMSDLAQQFREESADHSYNAWVKWYLEKHPNAIDKATEMAHEMIEKFEDAIEKVDKKLVRQWVEDLVLRNTYIGLIAVQEEILRKVAEEEDKPYRLSTPKEESKGIDGFIGDWPVSIKPITYKTKEMLKENIDVDIIYYEKTKSGLKIEYDF